MAAVEITSQCTFPEKLVQLVFLDALLECGAVEFEHDTLAKA